MTVERDLTPRLRATLQDTVSAWTDQLGRLLPPDDPLPAALRSATGGGKLLRPLFCWWGWRAGGGSPTDDRIYRLASALELLHAAALVHDDVLDGSDQRRGQPTVHRRFAGLHEERRWGGPPDAYGQATAVLAGDVLLTWADRAVRTSGFDGPALERAWSVFDAARDEVLAGQYLDVTVQAAGVITVESALHVLRLKSGRYTVERPLELGAVVAGATSDLLRALSAYAVPVGEAFQLRDDLLGVLGDPAVTGKPAGDDVREGKRTVLLALAYGAADAAHRAVLDRWVGAADLDAEGLDRVREVLAATGAVRACEHMITDRVSQARAALADIPGPAASALDELVQRSADRSA